MTATLLFGWKETLLLCFTSLAFVCLLTIWNAQFLIILYTLKATWPFHSLRVEATEQVYSTLLQSSSPISVLCKERGKNQAIFKGSLSFARLFPTASVIILFSMYTSAESLLSWNSSPISLYSVGRGCVRLVSEDYMYFILFVYRIYKLVLGGEDEQLNFWKMSYFQTSDHSAWIFLWSV